MHSYIIAASILSADIGYLIQETKAVLQSGADWLHIDVMDNHYVPNLTFGPLVCRSLRTHLPDTFLDVHLMVTPVDALINAFVKAGANQISFHPEASHNVRHNLGQIRQLGCKAGLAINPETSLDGLEPLMAHLDFLLMMSVNPGFSGQSFTPEVLPKISEAKQLIQQYNPKSRLGVDGGLSPTNIARVANAGADTFVIGSSLFESPPYAETLAKFRSSLHY